MPRLKKDSTAIQVTLLEAQEKEAPEDAVFNGKADFGVGTSDVVLLRAKGKPAVVLAPIFQHSPQAIIASQNSGIENIHNLVGKRIMIEQNAADIVAYMGDEGVSPNRCIVYPHSFDIRQLLHGDVDAMTVYLTDELFALQQADFPYTVISPLSGGIDFYGDNLFTSEEVIGAKPELVEAFLSASLKGWKYALAHPEELVNLIYDKYSKRHSKQHLRFEAAQMQKYILPDVIEVGYNNRGRWEGIIETYRKMNFINTSMTSAGLLYADYVKPKQSLPWRLIIIYTIALFVVGAFATFHYFSSRRLRRVMREREKVQIRLAEREKQLEETNATKDKFFSIVAHDLRSPFAALVGLSTLMVEDVETLDREALIGYSNDLHGLIMNQYKFLENLLQWVQLQKDQMTFTPVDLDVHESVETVLSLLRPSANEKKIALVNAVPAGLHIRGDGNMLHSVFQNLTRNAIKFSLLGGTVEITGKSDEKNFVFSIIDSGVGIRSEELNKVFRVDAVYSTRGTANEQGTGLGLVLCKEMIEKHGGTILVTSQIDKGTTFTFSIPRVIA
jgi:signal transduction histidine kinase